jgi:hypothetical protein
VRGITVAGFRHECRYSGDACLMQAAAMSGRGRVPHDDGASHALARISDAVVSARLGGVAATQHELMPLATGSVGS